MATDSFRPAGYVGAAISGGFQQSSGRYDTEFNPNLKGDRLQKKVTEMRENDGTFGTCVAISMALFCAVPWVFKSRSDSPRGRREVEFGEQVWSDMVHDPQDVHTDVYSFVWHGFDLHEIMLKRRNGPVFNPKTGQKDRLRSSKFSDGRMGIADLSPRLQASVKEWKWDEDGYLSHVIQKRQFGKPPTDPIPIEKFLHVRTENAGDNPEGRSFYRSLIRAYELKKKIEELEGVGAFKEVAGVIVGRLPWIYMQKDVPTAYSAALDLFKNNLSGFQRGQHEYILWPSSRDDMGKDTGFGIETLPGSMSKYNLDAIIKRWDHRIASLFNMGFIDYGSGGEGGNRALSVDQTSLYEHTLNRVVMTAGKAINKQVFEPLWDINGVPDEFRADLVPGPIARKDLEKFTSNMQRLIDCGALTSDTSMEVFTRDEMSYPPMDDPTEGNDTELVDDAVEVVDDEIPQLDEGEKDERRPTERTRSWVPSEAMRKAAAQALRAVHASPQHCRCTDDLALARAKDIAAGKELSLGTVERMHRALNVPVDKRAKGWKGKGTEWQAWHLWGGDAAKAWAAQVLAQAGPQPAP